MSGVGMVNGHGEIYLADESCCHAWIKSQDSLKLSTRNKGGLELEDLFLFGIASLDVLCCSFKECNDMLLRSFC